MEKNILPEIYYRVARSTKGAARPRVSVAMLISDIFSISVQQSDGEKSDQDLVVDDASEGPVSPAVNGTSSPRENGLVKMSSSSVPMNNQVKKEASPHSPRSATSSNASTPSAKKMDDREKTTTPISKPMTPNSASGSSKPSVPGKMMQVPPSGVPGAYPPHYPPGPPPHHLPPAAQHPHVDMLIGYNGYAAPRPPPQQLYDPHGAMRAPMSSLGVPAGKP